MIGAIFGSGLEKYIGDTRTAEFGNALISILYYGFGLFVAYRYSQTGLHVVGVISSFFELFKTSVSGWFQFY